MNKIHRLIVWICKRYNREQILNLVDELVKILHDKNPELQPRDDFKDKHPKYRDFSANPLAALDSAEIVKPKKT